MRYRIALLALSAALLAPCVGRAEVLPPDEADIMYKHYQGGGIKAEGPAYLVRKSVTQNASVTASYEIDQVTGASIDSVVSGASPIREERKQKSLGAEYLADKTTYGATIISSVENDYDSSTVNGTISQSMFGDLTTVTLSASRGWDLITRRVKSSSGKTVSDPTFRARLDRRQWSVGVSQIFTRNLIMGFDYEANTSQGYEQNPYRTYRYLDPLAGAGYGFAPEVYPTTRTGNAFAIKARYYLRWHAALSGGYRYYTDTWGIRAHTFEVGYTQPLMHDRLVADAGFRYYTQRHASFYSDLFPRINSQNYLARDRELSSLYTESLHASLTYELPKARWKTIKRSTASLYAEELLYRYRDFLNASVTGVPPGTEPRYSNSALNLMLLASFYF